MVAPWCWTALNLLGVGLDLLGKWLTPNTASGGLACRTLFFPDGIDWLAIVAGALLPLTYANSFEPFGTATPAGTAAAFRQMFDSFSFSQGVCRMIGEIIAFAGSTNPNPSQWLPCDGASLERTTYTDLFNVIGTTYGSVDGTHFNLPDMRGRTPVAAGSGSGLTPRAIGDVFGEETHTLTNAEAPSHIHTDTGHAHVEGNSTPTLIAIGAGVPAPSAVPSIGSTASASANLTASGGDGSHNNVQPSLALNYFIVAIG